MFEQDFVKVYLTDKDMPSSTGVRDNIESQWHERSKAFGMASDKAYVFGSTTEFATDHVYIIDEMTKILCTPRMMFSVDESDSKISIYIRPVHKGMTPDSNFEKKIVAQILSEVRTVFEDMPEGKRLQVDIEYEFLDKEEVSLTRAKSREELSTMLEHLKQ